MNPDRLHGMMTEHFKKKKKGKLKGKGGKPVPGKKAPPFGKKY